MSKVAKATKATRFEEQSGISTAEVGTIKAPLALETGVAGSEHRGFPRVKVAVPFLMWIGEASDRRFQASLTSVNLSVSGAFLESSYFLPTGTELTVRFDLGDGPVEATAEIVREERPDASGKGRSGLALRFLHFFGQTEVTLARLFLGKQLLEFAKEYLTTARARGLTSELERVVDALAAWELLKVSKPRDTWGLNAEE